MADKRFGRNKIFCEIFTELLCNSKKSITFALEFSNEGV